MKFFRKLFEISATTVWIAGALFVFCMFLKLFAPLSPVITAIVGFSLTLITFGKWTTAIMSIGGIILYVASWPITKEWGAIPGMLVWTLGILTWFAAVFMSFRTKAIRSVAGK